MTPTKGDEAMSNDETQDDAIRDRVARYLAFKMVSDTVWQKIMGDDYQDGYGEAVEDFALYVLSEDALDTLIFADNGCFEGDERERTEALAADIRKRGYVAWQEAMEAVEAEHEDQP